MTRMRMPVIALLLMALIGLSPVYAAPASAVGVAAGPLEITSIFDGKDVYAINAKDPSGNTLGVMVEDKQNLGHLKKTNYVAVAVISHEEKPVYCLEADVMVDPLKMGDYQPSDLTLTSDMINTMSLYSHFGYGNEDNDDSQNKLWYVAAQLLIWEELGNSNFKEFALVKNDGSGSAEQMPAEIAQTIDSMKQSIKDKVADYREKMAYVPQFMFNGNEIDGTLTVSKKELLQGIVVSEKSDKVISDDELGDIVVPEGLRVEKRPEGLFIQATESVSFGENEILINLFKPQDMGKSISFVAPGSQTIGSFALSESLQRTVALRVSVADEGATALMSKTAVAGSGELEGASLKVVKGGSADGEAVAEWVSGPEPRSVELAPGVYTMVETRAPRGYEVAESIVFRVREGAVEVRSGDGWAAAAGSVVRMEDREIADPGSNENEEKPGSPETGKTVDAGKNAGTDDNGQGKRAAVGYKGLVRTGDHSPLSPALAAVVAAGGVLAMALRKREI
ncbi:SpaA isopeptide-forming pilin-related protein [Paraeggerthella sp. LCP19S3_G8]|uniref:SpaA isopeptide-forming pilin-related protein n=1 Tax=Paraeggerthella sp. LCP19S3_G8 TaxID=3440248 RepID=UPI003F95B3DC